MRSKRSSGRAGLRGRQSFLLIKLPSAPHAARRRQAISAQFPGDRLVIPAGGLKVRSNDTDYRFRPHSAFAHLTGLGTDRNRMRCWCSIRQTTVTTRPCTSNRGRPARLGRVLLRHPLRRDVGRPATLGGGAAQPVRHSLRSDRSTAERPGQERRLDPVADRSDAADTSTRALLDKVFAHRSSVDEASTSPARPPTRTLTLAVALSELRLIKDEFEIRSCGKPATQTARRLRARSSRIFPRQSGRGRGER